MPGEIALLRAIAEPDDRRADVHRRGAPRGARRPRRRAARGERRVRRRRARHRARRPAGGRRRRAQSRARRACARGSTRATCAPSAWGDRRRRARACWSSTASTSELPLRGAHNLRNAMLALAVGACRRRAARPTRPRASPRCRVPSMRTAWTALGRATLVNDAYNANPGSTRAALDAARAAPAPVASASRCSAPCASSAPHADALHDGDRAARARRSGCDDRRRRRRLRGGARSASRRTIRASSPHPTSTSCGRCSRRGSRPMR